MRKYLQVASCSWRQQLAYRGDSWLSTGFSIFRVLLAFLLWRAIFHGADTFGGMTLPEMLAYYLFGIALQPLTRGDGVLWEFAQEIRDGRYAKYMVRPVSPLGYFIAASCARCALPASMNLLAVCLWWLLLRGIFAPFSPIGLLWAVPIVVLAILFNILFNYLLTTMAFWFTDVGGFYIVKGAILEFLTGALVPLHFLPGNVLQWSPFSYMVYYPTMLCLGKAEMLPGRALLTLSFWTAALLSICLLLQKRAPRAFEGVGA